MGYDNMLSSYKTAIARTRPSAPAMFAGPYMSGRCINWGVGKAHVDTEYFETRWDVSSVDEYDPHYAPERPTGIYKTIYCGYVANTLSPIRRAGLYMDMLQFMDKGSVAIIVVRADKIEGTPFEDGVMTKRGTFQKSYTDREFAKELSEFFGTYTVAKHGHYLIGWCAK